MCACIEMLLIRGICRTNYQLISLPQLQDGNNSSSEEEEAEEEDVDVALKKEVAQLQASEAKHERRFQALDSGANNVIFIRTQNLGANYIQLAFGIYFWGVH